MGANILKRSSDCKCDLNNQSNSSLMPDYNNPQQGNPDPRNFRVEKMREVDGRTVVQLIYPDCTNYEGRKILFFDRPWREVYNEIFLDPHFCDKGQHPSPIARFEPTHRGWQLAIRFAETI